MLHEIRQSDKRGGTEPRFRRDEGREKCERGEVVGADDGSDRQRGWVEKKGYVQSYEGCGVVFVGFRAC